MNPVRFYEYAFSSSVMIVLIGLLVGVWDLGALVGLFFVNAAMNLFGIMMEFDNENREKTRWAGFVYGSIVGIVPWKDYLFGERMYIVLSLSAKTVLAWIIFAGTLAPV